MLSAFKFPLVKIILAIKSSVQSIHAKWLAFVNANLIPVRKEIICFILIADFVMAFGL